MNFRKFFSREANVGPLSHPSLGRLEFESNVWLCKDLTTRFGIPISIVADKAGPRPEQAEHLLQFLSKYEQNVEAIMDFAKKNNEEVPNVNEFRPYSLVIDSCIGGKMEATLECCDSQGEYVIGVDLVNLVPIGCYGAD